MQGPNSPAELPTALPGARRTARRRGARRVRWAAACAFSCTGAWAQNDPNPYYIGITEGITRNSNINNVAGGPGDTNLSTGLVGGFDQQIGRQRVFGNANVSLNRYRTFTELNNTSYGASLGLNWATVGDLSGSVIGSASQGLANLQNNLLQQTSGRNLVRTEQLATRANWGGNGKLTLGGGYGYSQTKYTSTTLYAGDSTNKTADIGIYFHPGETLSLGTALRYTRSNSDSAYFFNGDYVPNRTSGRNIDLSLTWRPTALTGANARVSFTRQTDAAGGDGYSGLTGGLDFTYAATGKLSFTGSFNRDASTNGAFYNTFNGTTNTQPVLGLAANSSVSNTFSAGASYSATAKVTANANASYRRSTQDDNGSGLVGTDYRDTYKQYSLGVSWAIRRFWSLNCNVSRVQRSLSGVFADGYSGNTYSCITQVTLQ